MMASPAPTLALVLLVLTVPAVVSSANAEMYRWTDERGVPTYSNRPPAKTAAVKDLTVIEDRLSVYTPDAATLEAVKRERERRNAPNRTAYVPGRMPLPYAPIMPPPATGPYDPCLAGDDVNCYGYPGYYAAAPLILARPGSRSFGRSRLAPGGLIAGNVVGSNSFIAGLSTQNVPITTRRASASFTLPAARGHRSR